MSDPIRQAAALDGTLRFFSISHPTAPKSDAFLFALDGEVLLEDGGMAGCTDAIERLRTLREELCPGSRLRLVWVLSHFHIDHIQAALESILPDPDLEITEVWLPPKTRNTELCPRCGDDKYRAALYEALALHQPQANIHNLRFANEGGEPVSFPLGGARVTLLPPETDWTHDHLIRDIITEGYYAGQIEGGRVPTCVTNAASLWTLVEYRGRRILLNGDSMKREWRIPDENWDRMLALWGGTIGTGADLMKWPHHGMKRDPAAPGVHALAPKNILMTTVLATADRVWAEKYPDDPTPFWNSAERDLAAAVTADGEMKIEYV